MTSEQHNKYLAMSHIAHGSFQLLMMLIMLAIFGVMLTAGAGDAGNGPPAAFFWIMMAFILVFNSVFTFPSFLAAYGFLKRKRWAKTAGIVSGVLAAMSFPIGTAVCVYTFWFLFSNPGKELYDKPANMLPPPPPLWLATETARRPVDYAGRTPPDWR
jgi:hypothetical protein